MKERAIAIVEAKLSVRSLDVIDAHCVYRNCYHEDDEEERQAVGKGGVCIATDAADKVTEQRNAGRPSRQSGKEKENPRVMAKARVKEKEKEMSSGEVSAVTAAAKWRTAVATASTR